MKEDANMQIIVKKPTNAEKQAMQSQLVWTCEVSEFDWYYDSEETCLLLEGEVTVTYNGGSVNFGAGDYVVFPKGFSCVWKVTKPVKKHYISADQDKRYLYEEAI
jgi:uncharacterized cupin superfamily protein